MESDLSPGLNAGFVAPVATDPVPGRRTGRFPAWLGRVLSTASRRDYRRAFCVAMGVIAALGTLVVLHGPCLQIYYGHDDLGFLAAAWKVRCGTWPHADYHSALGALNPWIHAAGMWVLGPTATVLPFCNALVAVGLGLLAWTVAARRLPALLAGVFAFLLATMAMTPHLLRFEWFAATYDGYYNRQSYALLVTLLLLLFVPPSDGKNALDERIAGAILGVLLFLKVSYFMAGIGLCVTAFVLGGRFLRHRQVGTALRAVRRISGEERPATYQPGASHSTDGSESRPYLSVTTGRWRGLLTIPGAGVILAFGITFLLCLPLIRFDLAAMLGDLRLAAGARAGNPAAAFTLWKYLSWLPDAWLEVVLLGAAQAVLRPPWFFRREACAGTPSWAEFVAVVGASMFLCMTNSPGGEHSETPLLTCWVFVLLGSLLRPGIVNETREKIALPFVCGVACVLCCYTFGNGLFCLGWSASPWPTRWQQAALAQAAPRFDTDSLASLRILGAGGEPYEDLFYADKVNDGVRLLRALGGTHRVEALDFVDPFPFALRWPAVRGGLWCWHNGYSFSATAHPPPEEAFGDADVLMIPKFPGELASFRAMRQLYAPFVRDHFKVATESDQWILLQRR